MLARLEGAATVHVGARLALRQLAACSGHATAASSELRGRRGEAHAASARSSPVTRIQLVCALRSARVERCRDAVVRLVRARLRRQPLHRRQRRRLACHGRQVKAGRRFTLPVPLLLRRGRLALWRATRQEHLLLVRLRHLLLAQFLSQLEPANLAARHRFLGIALPDDLNDF